MFVAVTATAANANFSMEIGSTSMSNDNGSSNAHMLKMTVMSIIVTFIGMFIF